MTTRSGRTLQGKRVRPTWNNWWSAVWRQQWNFECLILWWYSGGSCGDLATDGKILELCTFRSWLLITLLHCITHWYCIHASLFGIAFMFHSCTAARFLWPWLNLVTKTIGQMVHQWFGWRIWKKSSWAQCFTLKFGHPITIWKTPNHQDTALLIANIVLFRFVQCHVLEGWLATSKLLKHRFWF